MWYFCLSLSSFPVFKVFVNWFILTEFFRYTLVFPHCISELLPLKIIYLSLCPQTLISQKTPNSLTKVYQYRVSPWITGRFNNEKDQQTVHCQVFLAAPTCCDKCQPWRKHQSGRYANFCFISGSFIEQLCIEQMNSGFLKYFFSYIFLLR